MATVSRWALLDGQGACVAVILWDGNTQTYDPAPLTAVAYNPAVHVVAADPLAVNKATLTDKATRATAANIADIAACDAISGAAAFTATQRDNAIRELARQSAVQARQLNVLIKLQLDQLDDTSGT